MWKSARKKWEERRGGREDGRRAGNAAWKRVSKFNLTECQGIKRFLFLSLSPSSSSSSSSYLPARSFVSHVDRQYEIRYRRITDSEIFLANTKM